MEDYFSIDDILAGEPKLYTTFLTQAHLLAHLDPIGVSAHYVSHPEQLEGDSQNAHHIPEGHRIALPFWIVESLAPRNIITVELPRCYATPTRNALRADAKCVDLYARCQHYFSLGVRLAKLLSDVSLPAVLVNSYANRCWYVADSAVFAGSKGATALRRLDTLERHLFFAAHGVSIAMRRWKERRVDRIEHVSVLGKRNQEQVGSPITPATSRARVR